jgi:hypothetical protein
MGLGESFGRAQGGSRRRGLRMAPATRRRFTSYAAIDAAAGEGRVLFAAFLTARFISRR